MRSPNLEQKKAIEHNGGVLLSAGAGSGKTFVLVEHIIYLIENFSIKNQMLDEVDLTRKLKSFLGSIVLMTFTKKAAGELLLRLRNRIEQQAVENGSMLWLTARESISSMFVGTIHSFCNRLLQQGFFIDVDPNFEMISDAQLAGELERLFRRWYDTECRCNYPKVQGIYAANSRDLMNSLTKIFGDPSLRLFWKKADFQTCFPQTFFSDYLEVTGLNKIYDFQGVLSTYHSEGKKGWYKLLRDFFDLPMLDDMNSFNKLCSFFEENKVIRGPQKNKGFDDILDLLSLLKKLRKFIKDNREDIDSYNSEKNGAYSYWFRSMKSLVDFIDKNYNKIGGITFADLEYLVLTGVQDLHCAKSISKSYSYFIVDEFQDTSMAQYEIITRILDGNHNNIFCVGDLKQAIYGFRGGELGVFLECQKKVDTNLTMTNNYRSASTIIKFNNQIFENIFAKGLSYEGTDSHHVVVEHQTIPVERDYQGDVFKINVAILDRAKLTSEELSRIEARSIFEQICQLQSQFPLDEICVLYKKLAPSSFLIDELLKKGLGITAQVKVPIGEDPLVGIAVRLLEELLESSDCRRDVTSRVVTSYLCLLGLSIPIEKHIDHFYRSLDSVGFMASFRTFLFSLGLSNSNYRNNIKLLEDVSSLALENMEILLQYLKRYSAVSYSIEFQKGEGAGKVRIMTTHASKGLEFDHVLFGGIHNNSRSISDNSFFGKLPASFKWKINSSQKKSFKSPVYIIEEQLKKQKDFSESKRLFYVAGTRAVKTISWINISSAEKDESLGKESWINAIRSWERDGVNVPITERSIQVNLDEIVTNNKNSRPLFHQDSLGLYGCDQEREMLVVSELSVTRLASIADCSRKFYLQNICKIPDDVIGLSGQHVDGKKTDTDKVIRSSAQRGTDLHQNIADYLEGSSPHVSQEEKKAFDWVTMELDRYKDDYEFISEVPMKFAVFGVMITGIPDLILKRDGSAEIWDFKTGAYSKKKEASYWFQLFLYAYAVLRQYELDEINLVLSFIDEQKNLKQTVTYDQVESQVKREWRKLASFDQVNSEHCPNCHFSTICHD